MSESEQEQIEKVRSHNVLVLKHTYALIHVNRGMLAKVVREEMNTPTDEFAVQVVTMVMDVLSRLIDHIDVDPGFTVDTATELQPSH